MGEGGQCPGRNDPARRQPRDLFHRSQPVYIGLARDVDRSVSSRGDMGDRGRTDFACSKTFCRTAFFDARSITPNRAHSPLAAVGPVDDHAARQDLLGPARLPEEFGLAVFYDLIGPAQRYDGRQGEKKRAPFESVNGFWFVHVKEEWGCRAGNAPREGQSRQGISGPKFGRSAPGHQVCPPEVHGTVPGHVRQGD